MEEKKWLALYTRPRYEKKIHTRLQEIRIESYLPLIKTLRQWSDRKKWVELPLFKSYLFVKVNESERLKVLNIYGSLRFVSFEGKAVEVPENQIANIKWVLSTSVKASPFEEKIEAGSKVQIVAGPLAGIKAEMVHYKKKNRVIIRIEQLDKYFEVQIPRNQIKVLSHSKNITV